MIIAILLPPLGAFFYFVVLADSPLSNDLYGAIKLTMLAVGIAGWRLSRRSLRVAFRASLRDVRIGLIAGATIALVLFAAYFLMQPWLAPFGATIEAKSLSLFPIAWYAPLAILFSLVHALFEEWYWRGFVHAEILRKVTPTIAPLLSAIAFSGHHVIVLTQLFPGPLTVVCTFGVFVVGIFWATLYQRTQTLVPSWISHVFADAAIFTIGYFMM